MNVILTVLAATLFVALLSFGIVAAVGRIGASFTKPRRPVTSDPNYYGNESYDLW